MKLWNLLLIVNAVFISTALILAQSKCVHDSIQPTKVVQSKITYEESTINRINKRDTEGGRGPPHRPPPRAPDPNFSSIRIHTSYRHLDAQLNQQQQNQLVQIIEFAVDKVEKIFSVRPVLGKLLLTRAPEACTSKWRDGPNAGKCSRISSGYERNGETCLDGFKIPEEHLEGLWEWSYSGPEPSRVFAEDGQGLPDTDYVLYVTSSATAVCVQEGKNVIAYAGFCQQDQNFRPIAGLVNVCPDLLATPDYDIEKAKVTALHEIFHALGFSSKLFSQFRDCSGGGACQPYRRPVRTGANGVPRLVTPRAREHAKGHFRCMEPGRMEEFGPILQKVGQDLTVSSHWDAAFMQSSIMTPTIGLAELTFVDAITLAVFEDSGWYRVNFRYAEPFQWGRGAGCDFAVGNSCDSDAGSKFFCERSGSAGCHYLHGYKGRCETDDYLFDCRVMKAYPQDSCQVNMHGKTLPGEIFRQDSKCFMSNISLKGQMRSSTMEGRCFQHRCRPNNKQEVKLDNTLWFDCPSGKLIQIPDYNGQVECPDVRILCAPPPPNPHHNPPPFRPSQGSLPEAGSVVSIELSFQFDFRQLWRNNLLDRFKNEVASEIGRRTRCATKRIKAIDVYEGVEASTIFKFNLLPAEVSHDGPASDMVFEVLTAHVEARNFSVFINEIIYAQGIRTVPMEPTDASSGISVGVIAGIVVVLAVIAIVIGVLVFVVQRHHAIQSRVQQSNANYPSIANPSSSSQEGRRDSGSQSEEEEENSQDSRRGSCVDGAGSFSDLASYHSEVESSYPVSSGRYSSTRGSVRSKLSGIDNLAYSVGSKGSVTSTNSSASPSVMYVSTVNVKEGEKPDADTLSVKERVKILNLKTHEEVPSPEPPSEAREMPSRKVSNTSDDGNNVTFSNEEQKDGGIDAAGAPCNDDSIPHRQEDELTVTRIGIRDRTSSEITISNIRYQFLRQKLAEKMRVKSEDDVNVKTASPYDAANVTPFHKARFTVGGGDSRNRDSVVTISTVSSKDRSMSDVTISTLSRNSVHVASPDGSGEINGNFHPARNHKDSTENRFSNGTLSTVLSGDQMSVAEDEDSVFVNKEDPLLLRNGGSRTNHASFSPDAAHVQTNGMGSISTNGIKVASKEIPTTNGIDQRNPNKKSGRMPHNLHRTGSAQSRTSEMSCSHNHEKHRKRHHTSGGGATIVASGAITRPRNMSTSSESSLSSNGCSECDSCPYCRDCASIVSDENNVPESNNNSTGKFVSIVSTDRQALNIMT